MIGTTVGHYRIVEELGSGGMGVVYKAEDVRLGRHVALKFLPQGAPTDPRVLERFQREAQAASALNHPHICTIHDIDSHAGQPFIVMEFLDGQTLRERIASRRFDLDGVLKLGTQIAEALEAAHARGIIHRDIKPANIFVTDSGQAKILDFGLAKLVAERQVEADGVTVPAAPGAALVTGPGQTMGTAAYMSPEQVRGEELDARTDVFSLGVVLYEMATGTLPFQGAAIGLIFDGILNRSPIPASRLNPLMPVELDHILDKALEKDRDLRYQSARELRADLARLRRDSGSGRSAAAVASVAAPVPPRPKRRWLMVAAVGGVAVLLALAGYLAWSPQESSAPAVSRALTRITFDEGLQAQPTWSPDGRFLAYSSNHSGNFDIWVQPLGGGRAVQVTSDAAHDWQPSWSPDGNNIAFRSERDGGGIYVVPALGGRERRIAAFGYWPAWSPDGSRLLLVVRPMMENASGVIPHVYLATMTGAAPTRVLAESLAQFTNVRQITWHPNGQHLSLWGTRGEGGGLWALPLSGGAPVQPEIAGDVLGQLKQADVSPFAFTWAPAGDALYFEGLSKGVRNLWKVEVDPHTGRWVGGPERLTTGPGIDAEIAVSPDGGRLAFVTKTQVARLWSVPFDARARQTTAEGQAVTAANMSVVHFDVSADGTRLVYVATRPGKDQMELWTQSVEDGGAVLLGEAASYFVPRVSRDGTRVAYRLLRQRQPGNALRLAWLALGSGQEHTLPEGLRNVWDWSPDGEQILHNCPPPERFPTLCRSARDASAIAQVQPVVADPEHNIWQGRFSPDGRWVAFNAQNLKQSGVSVIGIVAAGGGPWVPITDAALWADKPRWAPDGETIYFISNRQGAFFDVWGLRFDPASGRAIGEEFRVTRFDNPGRVVSASGGSELGVSATRLVLPITESSGSVWVLDHIKQ